MIDANNSKHYSLEKETYRHGYMKFLSKAKAYLNNPEDTEVLLKKAVGKATKQKEVLSEVWEKLQLLLEALRAWLKGEYREIPTGSIVIIIATILYFVSPIDLIPDLIAGLGFFDDAAVIGFAIKQIYTDLEKFRAWKTNKDDLIN